MTMSVIHKWPSLLCMLVVTALLMGACNSNERVDKAQEAQSTDVNGYLCSSEEHADGEYKFFTERSVFAEKCPGCGAKDFQRVYAYVKKQPGPPNQKAKGQSSSSPKEPPSQPTGGGEVIIVPRGALDLPFHLPTSEELRQWGAAKAEEESVQVQ